VAFADILLVSDAIGVSISKGASPHSYRQLKELIQLKSLIQLDKINKRILERNSGEFICINGGNRINCSNCLIVSREYVDRAWDIIKPCLDYALTLVNYIELDKPIARLMDYLRRVKRAQHSTCMQYARLNANQMKLAIETLKQRGDIKVERKEIDRKGSGKIPVNFYEWVDK